MVLSLKDAAMQGLVSVLAEAKQAKQEQAVVQEIVQRLGELGGALTQEDSIARGGQKISIPSTMTLAQAHNTLGQVMEMEESEYTFSKTFMYRPWDGAHAVQAALKRNFGTVIGRQTPGSFFSPPRPPQLVTINTGVNETVQVPWGNIELPIFPTTVLQLAQVHHTEFGPLFQINVISLRKWRAQIEGLFKLVEEELKTNSIYLGKAIDSAAMPNFLDLSGVDRSKVVYSTDLETQLDVNLWAGLRYTEQMVKAGLPTKRSVMLTGKYGNGKTLAILLTAKEAVANGWTFIIAKPGDNLSEVMQTASLYAPCVVAFEDIDVVADAGSGVGNISEVLDTMDGLVAKGRRLLCVFTTNHPDKIHKGMLRPGRLDAVIHFGPLDEAGTTRLINAHITNDKRGNIDYAQVFRAMAGFEPAFAKEAIDRAKRYSLVRGHGNLSRIETADLVSAANGLRPQLELMEGSKEAGPQDSLTTAVVKAIRQPVLAGVQHIWTHGQLPEDIR